MRKILSKLWTLYQDKPAHVTVLSSGALVVDAMRMLSSDAARTQLAALSDFPTVNTQPALQSPVRSSNVAEPPLPEAHPAK